MAFPRAALRELTQKLSGIQTLWEGDAEPAMGKKGGKPGARIKIDVAGVKRIGQDETRATFDSVTQTRRLTSGGNRVWRLTFRAESLSNDAPGYVTLEDFAAKLRWQSSIDALAAAGLSVALIRDVIPIDYIVNSRSTYAAILEVEMSAVNVLVISDDDSGWIETVNGGGDIPGPDPIP